jgi:hypothetical protein
MHLHDRIGDGADCVGDRATGVGIRGGIEHDTVDAVDRLVEQLDDPALVRGLVGLDLDPEIFRRPPDAFVYLL